MQRQQENQQNNQRRAGGAQRRQEAPRADRGNAQPRNAPRRGEVQAIPNYCGGRDLPVFDGVPVRNIGMRDGLPVFISPVHPGEFGRPVWDRDQRRYVLHFFRDPVVGGVEEWREKLGMAVGLATRTIRCGARRSWERVAHWSSWAGGLRGLPTAPHRTRARSGAVPETREVPEEFRRVEFVVDSKVVRSLAVSRVDVGGWKKRVLNLPDACRAMLAGAFATARTLPFVPVMYVKRLWAFLRARTVKVDGTRHTISASLKELCGVVERVRRSVGGPADAWWAQVKEARYDGVEHKPQTRAYVLACLTLARRGVGTKRGAMAIGRLPTAQFAAARKAYRAESPAEMERELQKFRCFVGGKSEAAAPAAAASAAPEQQQPVSVAQDKKAMNKEAQTQPAKKKADNRGKKGDRGGHGKGRGQPRQRKNAQLVDRQLLQEYIQAQGARDAEREKAREEKEAREAEKARLLKEGREDFVTQFPDAEVYYYTNPVMPEHVPCVSRPTRMSLPFRLAYGKEWRIKYENGMTGVMLQSKMDGQGVEVFGIRIANLDPETGEEKTFELIDSDLWIGVFKSIVSGDEETSRIRAESTLRAYASQQSTVRDVIFTATAILAYRAAYGGSTDFSFMRTTLRRLIPLAEGYYALGEAAPDQAGSDLNLVWHNVVDAAQTFVARYLPDGEPIVDPPHVPARTEEEFRKGAKKRLGPDPIERVEGWRESIAKGQEFLFRFFDSFVKPSHLTLEDVRKRCLDHLKVKGIKEGTADHKAYMEGVEAALGGVCDDRTRKELATYNSFAKNEGYPESKPLRFIMVPSFYARGYTHAAEMPMQDMMFEGNSWCIKHLGDFEKVVQVTDRYVGGRVWVTDYSSMESCIDADMMEAVEIPTMRYFGAKYPDELKQMVPVMENMWKVYRKPCHVKAKWYHFNKFHPMRMSGQDHTSAMNWVCNATWFCGMMREQGLSYTDILNLKPMFEGDDGIFLAPAAHRENVEIVARGYGVRLKLIECASAEESDFCGVRGHFTTDAAGKRQFICTNDPIEILKALVWQVGPDLSSVKNDSAKLYAKALSYMDMTRSGTAYEWCYQVAVRAEKEAMNHVEQTKRAYAGERYWGMDADWFLEELENLSLGRFIERHNLPLPTNPAPLPRLYSGGAVFVPSARRRPSLLKRLQDRISEVGRVTHENKNALKVMWCASKPRAPEQQFSYQGSQGANWFKAENNPGAGLCGAYALHRLLTGEQCALKNAAEIRKLVRENPASWTNVSDGGISGLDLYTILAVSCGGCYVVFCSRDTTADKYYDAILYRVSRTGMCGERWYARLDEVGRLDGTTPHVIDPKLPLLVLSRDHAHDEAVPPAPNHAMAATFAMNSVGGAFGDWLGAAADWCSNRFRWLSYGCILLIVLALVLGAIWGAPYAIGGMVGAVTCRFTLSDKRLRETLSVLSRLAGLVACVMKGYSAWHVLVSLFFPWLLVLGVSGYYLFSAAAACLQGRHRVLELWSDAAARTRDWDAVFARWMGKGGSEQASEEEERPGYEAVVAYFDRERE